MLIALNQFARPVWLLASFFDLSWNRAGLWAIVSMVNIY